MVFEDLNLNKPLLKVLAELEYIHPTPIQEMTFPVIMSGRNVVGIAQTGTGKTFAYLLPLLRQLPYSEQRDPRILIVLPTRELVNQIIGEIQKLSTHIRVRSLGVYGGTNINTQKQAIHKGLDIIVATPGRLIDLNMSGVLKLKSIQKLVIDEVDKMLALGFRPELLNLMELLPVKRQNLMFSATLNEEIEKLINDYFPHLQKIEIAPHGTPIEKISQKAYYVLNHNTKVNLLELLLSTDSEMSKVLVFVKTKKLADRLSEQLAAKFPEQVGVIHSYKSLNHRVTAVKQFQHGNYKVLVATDIIARGMDIVDVSHVINFDMSEESGDYIHRIGRTGRIDKAGVAISFISNAEQAYQAEIEQLMEMKIPVEQLPENLVISNVYTEDEKPSRPIGKDYLKKTTLKNSQGAFHEKKGKNLKVNLGGPFKRHPKHGPPPKRADKAYKYEPLRF